jgi:1-acyl-sn-glycerol-3-phosphate acyltransferase
LKLALAPRLLWVLAHLLRGLVICGVVFPWLGRERRLACIARWSAQLLRIFRVEVELAGCPNPPAHGLWVANHVSWIDIFVINAVHPSRFVAKSEVRRWPLIGVLSAAAGTMFIKRGSTRELRLAVETLAATLAAGERVVVFPEGTSAAQGAMQPFRANLFEAAITAQACVQPMGIAYVTAGGAPHDAVEYIGDTSLMESMVRILSGEPVIARLTAAAVVPPGATDRRTLAQSAHDAVRAELASAPNIVAISEFDWPAELGSNQRPSA